MKIKCTTSFYHQNDYNENDEKYQILAIVWSNTRFSLLDKYPKEICVHLPQERYIRMFIAELFGVSLNLKGSISSGNVSSKSGRETGPGNAAHYGPTLACFSSPSSFLLQLLG